MDKEKTIAGHLRHSAAAYAGPHIAGYREALIAHAMFPMELEYKLGAENRRLEAEHQARNAQLPADRRHPREPYTRMNGGVWESMLSPDLQRREDALSSAVVDTQGQLFARIHEILGDKEIIREILGDSGPELIKPGRPSFGTSNTEFPRGHGAHTAAFKAVRDELMAQAEKNVHTEAKARWQATLVAAAFAQPFAPLDAGGESLPTRASASSASPQSGMPVPATARR